MKCALPEKKDCTFSHTTAHAPVLSLHYYISFKLHPIIARWHWWFETMLPKTWVNGCNMVQLLKGLTIYLFYGAAEYQSPFGGIYLWWVLLFCRLQIMSGSVNKLCFLQLLDFSTFTSSFSVFICVCVMTQILERAIKSSIHLVDWGEIAQRNDSIGFSPKSLKESFLKSCLNVQKR